MSEGSTSWASEYQALVLFALWGFSLTLSDSAVCSPLRRVEEEGNNSLAVCRESRRKCLGSISCGSVAGHTSDPPGPTLGIMGRILLSGIVWAVDSVSSNLHLFLHKRGMSQRGEAVRGCTP